MAAPTRVRKAETPVAAVKTPTKAQIAANDIVTLLKARNSFLWIVSREEDRVERYLIEVGAAAKFKPNTWDCVNGCIDMSSGRSSFGSNTQDIGTAIEQIRLRAIDKNTTDRGLWIMRDLPQWLAPGMAGAMLSRQLRNIARLLPGTPYTSAQALIVLSPSSEIPAELSDHVTVIEWPIPDRAEMETILDAAIASQEDAVQERCRKELRNGARATAIDAAVGLSHEEALSCYGRSLVKLGHIDANLVASEKKRVITREKLLEWYDPLPGGLDAVGGLDNLKSWLMARSKAYSQKARDYGLPAPKGVFVGGITGCGKSLSAKAVATAWNVPLLRLDLGSLKDKFVGGSETKMRRALEIIGAINRCVLWIDEIEKSLAGAINGGADGGVAADQLGTLLTWMEERKTEAFLFATANDVASLPPEFLRKGRFDEVFWVDLPTLEERVEILIAALKKHGRDPAKLDIDLKRVATKSETFTGAEVASLVPTAMFAAFNDDGREIDTRDLLAAAAELVPTSITMGDKIAKMREWAKGKARRATTATEEVDIPITPNIGRRVEAGLLTI